MSNWLHVAAIVRIDSLAGLEQEDNSSEKELKKIQQMFGKPLLYDSPREEWDNYQKNPQDYLPMGSEGSLNMSLWINPQANCSARYTVSIFGDLRDRSDCKSIINWFKARCGKIDQWCIRNACITVNDKCSTFVSSTTEEFAANELDADNSKLIWIDANDDKWRQFFKC